MNRPLAVSLTFLLAIHSGLLEAGERIVDSQIPFSFTVPDGFTRDPSKVHGQIIYAFHRPSSSNSLGTYFVIKRLDGTIDREKIDAQQVTALNPAITLSSEKWKGFDVEVFRVPATVDGKRLLRFNAQIPIAGEAIQVGILGEESREQELRALLQQVLRDLDGRSNWLNTEERGERVVYLLGGIVVVAFIWLRRRSAKEIAVDNEDQRARGLDFKHSGRKKDDRTSRFAGRGMLLGMAGGALVGGIWGYNTLAVEVAGALGGALLGTIPGLFVGLLLGLVAAAAIPFRSRSVNDQELIEPSLRLR